MDQIELHGVPDLEDESYTVEYPELPDPNGPPVLVKPKKPLPPEIDLTKESKDDEALAEPFPPPPAPKVKLLKRSRTMADPDAELDVPIEQVALAVRSELESAKDKRIYYLYKHVERLERLVDDLEREVRDPDGIRKVCGMANFTYAVCRKVVDTGLLGKNWKFSYVPGAKSSFG